MRDDVRDETCLPMRELLDALSLVVACRGNGADVVLAPDFDEGLCVRGAHLVGHLMPDTRSLRPAIRQVLQPSTVPIKLNPNTLAEYFNGLGVTRGQQPRQLLCTAPNCSRATRQIGGCSFSMVATNGSVY